MDIVMVIVGALTMALMWGIRQGTREAVSGQDIAGLVVGIAMLGYLLYASGQTGSLLT